MFGGSLAQAYAPRKPWAGAPRGIQLFRIELKKETFLDKRTMASRAVPRLTPTKLAPLLIDQLQNNEFNLYKPI